MLESARKELNGARAKQQMVLHAFVQSERDVSEILDHVAELIVQVGAHQPASPTLRIVNGSTSSKPVAAVRQPVSTGAGEPIPSGQRRILLALARYGACGKGKLAILTRYASNGGGFNNNLSALRTVGHIAGSDPIDATETGLRALGPFDPLPDEADALFAEWLNHPELGRSHREILRVLRELGRSMSKEEIAVNCVPPYEPNGGGFNNALSRLRTLGVIEGKGDIRLAEQLR